jgi:hypothetical protein
MGVISGHDLTLSHDCATPGCMGEADASGLCSECRRPARNGGLPNVRFERTGLVVDGDLDDEELRALARQLGRMQNAVRWWLGDILVLVENTWPKDGQPSFGKWDDVLAELGLEPATGAHYRRVARGVPIERRRERLSWSHHERVAKLPAKEQEQWLDRCEKEGLSVHHLHVATRVALVAPTDPAPDLELVATRLIAPSESIARWRAAAAERGVSLSALAVEALEQLVPGA